MKKKSLLVVLVLSLCLMLGLLAWGCGEDKQTISNNVESTEESGSLLAESSGTEGLSTEPESETEPEPIPEPEPYVEPELDLIMVGDVLPHGRLIKAGLQEDGTYNYDFMFEHVTDYVQEKDLAIINQEVVMAGEEYGYSGYPTFNSPTAMADSIAKAGFDVVLHATNHTLDKRLQGALNTVNYWKTNHPELAILGMYDSQEARDTIYVYEQDGIKVAILNYTYGTNGIPVPEDAPYIVNLMDKELVLADIEKAKELADFVIVCPHGGTEYVFTPSAWQKDWTKIFLKAGVDLVLGTHPHVIEPVEWFEREDGHRMLVYYSLGNFINSAATSKEGAGARFLGAMATVTLAKTEEGDVYIKDYGAEPTVTWVSPDEKYISTYFMDDFTEEMGLTSDVHKRIPVFTKQYCIDLWEQVMGDLDKANFKLPTDEEEVVDETATESENVGESESESTGEAGQEQ